MAEKLEIWGVKDPNISAQLALAMKLDMFKEQAGLDVSCKFIESGTTMPKDVLEAEQKPFAFIQTPITAILLHDKGFSTKIVAPLADIAGAQQIIVRETSGIATPKDLEGKRIGMAKGAAVYIAITNMAKDCRVDIDKMYFINLLPHDQLTAFEDGRLDAMACWEPWTTKAQALGGKFFFSGSRSAISGIEGKVSWLINQSCLIVPDGHLQQEPEVVLAILRVLREATHLINFGFKEVIAKLVEFFEIPEPELTAIMHKNSYAMAMDNLFRIGILSFRDFLTETDRISVQLAEEQLYTPDFLTQVDPCLMTLKDRAAQQVKIIEKDGIYYRENTVFEGDTSELRFLLVDDSQVVRTILGQVLEILGGKVVAEAITGDEAIKFFTKFRPNFVTMDLSMPGLSGVDAIRHILQIDPQVNIIVISGLELQEVREEVFNLGAKMYLPKPFDPERAAVVIQSIIDAKGSV
jgi:ABC-type nitrate/sulfonate/bicarbonate transport system substrate-binding protein/CheY-like chemotaxis protein